LASSATAISAGPRHDQASDTPQVVTRVHAGTAWHADAIVWNAWPWRASFSATVPPSGDVVESSSEMCAVNPSAPIRRSTSSVTYWNGWRP
jgi:hypothetical protein